jgi:hypothetical protein
VRGDIHPKRRASAPRCTQRGFVGLFLALLFLMLLWLPIMYWQTQLADEQRVRDRQIKKMLAPTPASAPAISPT